jgi:hypothetical protein
LLAQNQSNIVPHISPAEKHCFLPCLKNFLLLTTLCLFLFAPTDSFAGANGVEVTQNSQTFSETKSPVMVETNPRLMETTYRIKTTACEIGWIVYNSDLNKGVVKNHSNCSLSLQDRVPLLSRILAELLSDQETAVSFHTLFWGRLTPSTKQDTEMSYRLAMAAHFSRLWDSERGSPKSGHVNDLIVKLANDATIYSELKKMFEMRDRNLEFSGAEKVLVMKADQLPFFDQLKKHGVKATDKLPFDCLSWFSVSRLEQ